jgi:hypothetical protein
MKFNIAIFALIAGLAATTTAVAEDRIAVGYNFGDVSADSWGVSAEKNLFDVGPATVYVDGSAVRLDEVDNTTIAAGGGVQFALTDTVIAKFGVVNNFAESADDFLTYKAGLVYGGDAWRFSGSLLKSESVDTALELTAERKVFGDFGLGLGALVDQNDYISTQVFGSYSF